MRDCYIFIIWLLYIYFNSLKSFFYCDLLEFIKRKKMYLYFLCEYCIKLNILFDTNEKIWWLTLTIPSHLKCINKLLIGFFLIVLEFCRDCQLPILGFGWVTVIMNSIVILLNTVFYTDRLLLTKIWFCMYFTEYVIIKLIK